MYYMINKFVMFPMTFMLSSRISVLSPQLIQLS